MRYSFPVGLDSTPGPTVRNHHFSIRSGHRALGVLSANLTLGLFQDSRHPTRIRPDDVVSPDAWLRKPVENSKGRDVFWLLQLCVFRLGFLLRVNISIRLIAPLSEMSVTFCV